MGDWTHDPSFWFGTRVPCLDWHRFAVTSSTMWNVIFQSMMLQKWTRSLALGLLYTSSPIPMETLFISLASCITPLRLMLGFSPHKHITKFMVDIQKFSVRAFRWSSILLQLLSVFQGILPTCQLSLTHLLLRKLNENWVLAWGLDYVRRTFLHWTSSAIYINPFLCCRHL